MIAPYARTSISHTVQSQYIWALVQQLKKGHETQRNLIQKLVLKSKFQWTLCYEKFETDSKHNYTRIIQSMNSSFMGLMNIITLFS